MSADEKKPLLEDIEALKKGEEDPLPLLFGRYEVSPQTLLRAILGAYTAFFVVHRVADLLYLLTCDARFPEGLGYLYPSEHERLQSVSYTRQTVLAGFLRASVTYCVVLAIFCTGILRLADDCLRTWLHNLSVLGGEGGPIKVVMNCFSGCLSEYCGACCTKCCCGFSPKWGRLFRGAVFLTLFAAIFYIVHAPFKIWFFHINVDFGFTNTLTITPAMQQAGMWRGFWNIFTSSIPQFMLYLLVLQCRFGWLFMWVGLISMAIIAQFHMGVLAPMIFDARNAFPSTNFAVGRGFPLVDPQHAYPWVSLNRIYFGNGTQSDTYLTHDKSKGNFELTSTAGGSGHEGRWIIQGKDGTTPRLAEAAAKVTFHDNGHDLEKIERQHWEVDGKPAEEAAIAMRRGGALRDELFDFAKKRDIGVGQVFMIDGSHADARANAFVAGAGADRVIGLYDTLFLGDNSSQEAPDTVFLGAESRPLLGDPSSAEGGVPLFMLSERVTGADTAEQGEPEVWHSTPTMAMSDDEIMAILAHELGHAAMHDVEQNMVVQAVTSFMTFATLGWMVQSPLLAASLGFAAPMGHAAVLAFDHVVAPTLNGMVKFFTDGLTRRKEYIADAYAAQVSERYATGLQTALAKLVVNSNQDPDEPWFYEMLHADHPTLANRWANIAKVKEDLYGDKSKRKRATMFLETSASESAIAATHARHARHAVMPPPF